jgi:hypothetical protein
MGPELAQSTPKMAPEGLKRLRLSQSRFRQRNRHKCNQNLHNLGRLPPLP